MAADPDESFLEGIEGDAARLEAERALVIQTDNGARPDDGEQPAEVEA